MGKQKHKKPSPPPAPAEPNLIDKIEDSVAGTAQGLSSTVKTHKTTLIAVGIIIIALIPIVYIVDTVQTRNERQQSGAIEEALEGEPGEIRSRSTDLLKSLEGKPLEPVMALRFGQWLANEQNERKEALRIAKEVQVRHPDDLLLNDFIANVSSAIEADEDFTVPEPPQPEGPAPGTDDGAMDGDADGDIDGKGDATADTIESVNETTISTPASQPTTQPDGG